MELLPPSCIKINQAKIDKIDAIFKSIYRLIIYSRHHSDDDLLDSYLKGTHSLKELLSIKNAQMEAQNEFEATEYLTNFKKGLEFAIEEIIDEINFESELQLFQLLRLTSPEAYAIHPNRYRHTFVQIGSYMCPEPQEVSMLVNNLLYQMKGISNPIIRAIYFHHELIRIHPFSDGNGRVTRLAKNWMLMYDLYPPTFITDTNTKKEYVNALADSFNELTIHPGKWNQYTELFFEQELDNLLHHSSELYSTINRIGLKREAKKHH